jgi:hypothetical protein
MVSAWFLTKVVVAFAPLTTVYAQYNTSVGLPLLLDATAEELSVGLESGTFTSLDLVQVRITTSTPTMVQMHHSRPIVNMFVGLCRTYPRGQHDLSYGR